MAAKEKGKIAFSLFIRKDLYDRLGAEKDKRGFSRAALVNLALEDYFAMLDNHGGKIAFVDGADGPHHGGASY